MTHHRKTRPEPNAADPLSEPTLGRRVWAAYLQRGFNRSRFAKAMSLTYVAVDDWCIGVTQPSLTHLMRVVELFDGAYTLDQLAFGHASPSTKRSEPELDREAIKRLLAELRASNEQIEALGEYERSAAGQFQRYTRTYIASFVEAFAGARERGHSTKQAIATAKEAAANARANAEAIALQARAVSVGDLAALGAELRAEPAARARKVSSTTTTAERSDGAKKPPSAQRRGA